MAGTWVKKECNSTVIVFVHGVLSSNSAAWRNKLGLSWPKVVADDPEIDSADVYTFDYNTSFFSGTYRLGDAVSAMSEYFNLDGILAYENLIFVCHSMGGIVARKFIVESALELKNKSIRIGLFLIASPSLGSNYANWLSPLAKLVRHSQADALRFSQTNAWLLDLDKEFLNLKESQELELFGKELIEDKFILPGLMREQVVTPISGARYFGRPFKVPNSDHSSIATIDNNSSIQHRLLSDLIQTVQEKVSSAKSDQRSHQVDYEAPSKRIRRHSFEALEFEVDGVSKYFYYKDGNKISYAEAIKLFRNDNSFIELFNSVFAQCGHSNYIWEMKAITRSNQEDSFELVIHSLPASQTPPDREIYRHYFKNSDQDNDIVVFENLGGDALLVVPSPYRENSDYGGMPEFLKEAPTHQKYGIWQKLAEVIDKELSDIPIWVSIAGGGVRWLHIRVDKFPKYYRYAPYRRV